jgi:hypothetical protein
MSARSNGDCELLREVGGIPSTEFILLLSGLFRNWREAT